MSVRVTKSVVMRRQLLLPGIAPAARSVVVSAACASAVHVHTDGAQDAVARKAAGCRALEQPSSRRSSRDFAADGAAHLARL
jgi:hypothetical protein